MDEAIKTEGVETAQEKKNRLRAARKLADELREEALDEKHMQRRAIMQSNKMSASEIYLEYAKIILENVLNEELVKKNILDFSEGNTDHGKRFRARVCYAVSNMASDLAKQHIILYP